MSPKKKYHIRLILNVSLIIFLLQVTAGRMSYGANNFSDNLDISKLKNLPQNDVNCIYKDRYGFLWIGTLDGLHRYDGYDYKSFRVNDGANSISSNLIIDIDEDSFGNIWIATYDKGLCKFDPRTEKFTSYRNTEDAPNLFESNDITRMMVDNKNVIWIGNWYGISNRIIMDSKMEHIQKVEKLRSLPSINKENNNVENIKSFLQDKNGNIWIGTNQNLYRCLNPYDKIENLRYEHFEVPAECLCQSDDGIIAGGIEQNEIIIEKDKIKESYKIKHISEFQSNTSLFYQDHTLWIGNRDGIYVYNHNGDHQWIRQNHFYNNFSGNGISCNMTSCITGDKNGQIWVGTRGGGIIMIKHRNKSFETYKAEPGKGSISDNLCRSIFEDHYRNLWLGTEEGGINVLPAKEGTNYKSGFKQIIVNDRPQENRGYALEEIMLPHSKVRKSVIWAGTSYFADLVAIDPLSLKKLPMPEFIKKIGFVFAIKSYNDSIVWVGTYGFGLFKFTIDSEGNIVKSNNYIPDKTQPHSISSIIIRNIFKDSKGNLWIGTDKGINLIPVDQVLKDEPKFQQFTTEIDSSHLSYNYILQIIEARNGQIWIGTMGGGLLSYYTGTKPYNGYFKAITTKDGLPNNAIKSIAEDDHGLLWLSSNKGLSRYNPQNGEIINYDVNDGLQDNEFGEICALKRANGQLIFGGIHGFNVFYPEEIRSDTIKPRMFLTDFYIQNKEVIPNEINNGRTVLEKTLQYTSNIKLKYKENSFSIGFVALQFNSPQKNNYKYQLVGFDKQWITTSATNRIAKYTNIPPGDYLFQVIGSNCDNLWNDKPAELAIHIEEPFYLRMNAIMIYLILIGVALWYTIRTSRIIARRKQEVLLANIEKNKTEEISQIKLRFFTNISHEFRTPLTLIFAPLEDLIKNNSRYTKQERQENYQLIKRNTNVLMRMINQLMDFRKLDQNKLKLKVQKIELYEFLDSIYRAFLPLAKQKNIDFSFTHNEPIQEMWFDQNKIENVMYNLLSNAFKFTPSGGKINIGVINTKEGDDVIIFIKDTGIGIEKEEAVHIFERYYQPNKKQSQTGTGIGLIFSKELVELHHGTIKFDSEKGQGTTFSIHLQKGNKHFGNEEMVESESPDIKALIETLSDESQSVPLSHSDKNKGIKKLLIVEDNIDLNQLLSKHFQSTYEVFSAVNGFEALQICRKIHPNLVISDVMMPIMNGMELCQNIKSDEEISHIPVLLLTAKNAPESQIEGLNFGADSYLTKPFNMEVLHASIDSLIKNREILQQKFSKEIQINPDIISHSQTDTRFLNKILSIIENNLSNNDFSVEQLAAEYGVSRIYLNRKIKALTDETSNQFILSIRLKHAAAMLKNGNMTISEVTWAVGYNDLRTFRDRFKEKFGVSPSEFQKSMNKETNL